MQSSGKLIYSPRTHLASGDRWLILSCDDEISRYYRFLFEKQYPYLNGNLSGKLTRPVWGAHISLIRGEVIPNFHLWKLYKNKIIEFEYEGDIKDNGLYFWASVKSPRLEELRKLYGLSPHPKFGFHLTIGVLNKNE